MRYIFQYLKALQATFEAYFPEEESGNLNLYSNEIFCG